MHQIAIGRRAFVLAAIVVLLAVLSLAVKPTLKTARDAPDERLNTTDVRSQRNLMTILSCRRPPHVPSEPLLKSTYAASFPGSGDKIITQNLVEGMTGMFIGESNMSPSIAKASPSRQQVRGLVSRANEQVTGSSPQSSQRAPLATEPVTNEQSPGSSDGTRRVLQAHDPAKFALDTELRQQEASEERLRENTELSDSVRPQGEVILVRSQFPHTSGKLVRVAVSISEQATHLVGSYEHFFSSYNEGVVGRGHTTCRRHPAQSTTCHTVLFRPIVSLLWCYHIYDALPCGSLISSY